MSADDHRSLLRDTARSFLARRGDRARVRPLRGTLPGYERTYWGELADLGCIGALAPAAHGGVGLALDDMCAMVQELAPGLAPEPVVPVAVGCVGLLALAPDSELTAALLTDICEGRIVPSLAWEGPGMRFADSRLDGQARFVVPAQGDGWLVVAGAPEGPMLCWVPGAAAGVTVRIEPRVDGTACAEVTFKSVVVKSGRRTPLGFDDVARVKDHCRIAASAELLGVAESALRMTLDYLKVRTQFGRLLGSFQALQHRAVDLFVKQELTRAALAAALEEPSAVNAARAKARACDSALTIGREAVQMHGAMGFADECDVGLHLKRALVLAAWLGNATEMRARIAEAVPAADFVVPAADFVVPAKAGTQASAVVPAQAGTQVLAPAYAGETPAEETTAAETAPDWESLPDEDFRQRVRVIFEREYPAELRNPPRRLRWAECRDFYFRLGQLGLAALAWPKEFGGAGLSPRKQLIFMQEQDRWGVARAPDMGITMVGPGLMQYGTPAQQEKYLPEILAWNHMWCQGFSEPDAGSDLASLRTKAVREGDGYVIDGTKLWTTFAQDATHVFLLARTDPVAKKQAGISMFLVDLGTPGITVRTITDIAGHDEFCEVRFEGVRVPADAMLGEPNQGWTVAKTLLGRERIYLGNPRQSQYALKRVDAMVERTELRNDPVFMARLTQLRLDVWDLAALYQRFADQVRRGEPLGADVSILKLFGSETFQRISELAVEGLGSAGMLEGAIPLGGEDDDVMSLFFNARPTTIYGGSNEVQRNVLAKQVLELPGA